MTCLPHQAFNSHGNGAPCPALPAFTRLKRHLLMSGTPRPLAGRLLPRPAVQQRPLFSSMPRAAELARMPCPLLHLWVPLCCR